MGLSDKIQDPALKAKVVADCVQLLEAQVASKSGISGMALKAAYRVIQGIDASYVPGAIGRLLPEAFAALDPLWQEALATNNPVEHIEQNPSRAADLLLSATDARIERVGRGVVYSTYGKLRKSIKPDVEAAVPGLATILDQHMR